jgi:hypothetical protein
MKTAPRKVLTARQTRSCLHVLAPAMHRQWSRWQPLVAPAFRDENDAQLDLLQDSDLRASGFTDLAELVSDDGRHCGQLVENVVGKAFACPPGALTPIVRDRLGTWVVEARQTPSHFVHWLTLAQVPFSGLPPESQAPYYRQAAAMLQAMEQHQVSNLVLPDPMPTVKPHGSIINLLRRANHRCGVHGRLGISEDPWSFTCQFCNRKWTV